MILNVDYALNLTVETFYMSQIVHNTAYSV